MSEISLQPEPEVSPVKDRPVFVLVDGYSLLFRAYHSMGDMKAADGTPTGALFGLTSMLIKAIQEIRPDYLLVAFDAPGPTFRHREFEQYKAHRDRAPEELRVQMGIARDLVKVLGIGSAEVEGFEADDVIGTLAVQAADLGWDVKILSGDSDLGQLVNDRITVIQTVRGVTETRTLDPATVRERYGIPSPANLVDYKALVGDPSDNIPGVAGIGEVTAKKVLAVYPTVEEVFSNLERIDEKIRRKLQGAEDTARLCKRLVTIRTDLPLKLDEKAKADFRFDSGRIDRDAASALFRKLGFKMLAERLGLEARVSRPEGIPVEVRIIDTEDALEELVSRLARCSLLALDYETTDLRPLNCDLVGISVTTDGENAYYIPVGHQVSLADARPQLPVSKVMNALKDILENPGIRKICQNAKYEWLVSHRYGIELKGLSDDPMIADYLIDPDRRHGLKEMAERELGWSMTTIEELIGKRGKSQKCMSEVPVQKAASYAAADVAATWRLAHKFADRLKQDGLDHLYRDVEIPLEVVLSRMEAVGVTVNAAVLREIARELDSRLNDMSKVIFQAVGTEVNLNSPKQLAELLFDRMKLPQIKGRSTDAEVLAKLGRLHEVAAMISEYRAVAKLRGTYTENLIELIGADGRIHTSYNQTVTGTGRLSSSDPNLQNIPVRSEMGQKIRVAFEPNEPGDVLLSCDYSQIELRLLAHFSGDQALVNAFRQGEDIHKRTAMEVFGVGPDEVTPELRRNAKVINFGIIYGMGAHGLSEQLGKSRAEAKEIIDRFFSRFPRVKDYFDSTLEFGRKNGYVQTFFGRRKYFLELRSQNRVQRAAAERAAVNMPLQGSSADIIKIAMVRLQEKLEERGLPKALVMQVHDELVLSVPSKDIAELSELVGTTMSRVCELNVPLVVNCKAGPNWLDLSPVGDFSN